MRLIVDHVWTKIEGKYPEILVSRATSYKVPGFWFAASFRNKHWDGFNKLLDKRGLKHKFPTGLLSRVTEQLDLAEWNYTLEDTRTYPAEPKVVTELPSPEGVRKIRDYQLEALELAHTHLRGVIAIATGGGKSLWGAALCKSLGVPPTLWLTHRTNLMYQTHGVLSDSLQQPVGLLGDGHAKIENVTVAMVQTLDHSKELKNKPMREFFGRVQLLIGDEIHHLGSDSDQWYRNILKIGAPYRFGLTATPNFSGHGLKLLAMTGPEIFRITAAELIQRGVLVPPRIWVEGINSPLLDEKMKGATVYKFGIVENEERNEKIGKIAAQFAEERKPTLILVRQISHGKKLMEILGKRNVSADFVHGKVPEMQRQLVVSALKQGLLDAIVGQVEVFGEGTDFPWLRALINAQGGDGGGDASKEKEWEDGRKTIQVLGRALRRAPGKEYCDVVEFADYGHKSLRSASSSRIGTLVAEGHEEYIREWNDYEP